MNKVLNSDLKVILRTLIKKNKFSIDNVYEKQKINKLIKQP